MQSLDRLDIDTPEQIALELPLAGIGSRFLALAVDSLLQFVAIIVIFLVGWVLAVGSSISFKWLDSGGAIAQTIYAIAAILIPFCLYWGYFAFFEIIWQGRTPGKRVAGIRVIHQTGRPMTGIECIGRNLMRGIDIFPPPIYGVGLICMMCNAQNRRLGDFIAGTIVVHDKSLDSVPSASPWGDRRLQAGPAQPSQPVQLLQPELRKLTADDLVLIETYLNRRYEIDNFVRMTTAQRIVAMIAERSGVPKPAELKDDDYLEAVARQLRDGANFR